MRFFQHVLSLCEIERTRQLDAWLERFDAVVVPGAQPGASGRVLAKGRVMVSWPPVAERLCSAILLDSMLVFPRVHAAIDGHLATARGAWSDWPFVSAVLPLLASAPERAA